jgi:hypothetical protein
VFHAGDRTPVLTVAADHTTAVSDQGGVHIFIDVVEGLKTHTLPGHGTQGKEGEKKKGNEPHIDSNQVAGWSEVFQESCQALITRAYI